MAHEYVAALNRYEQMQYRRCGKSGIHLPLISLGLWHNFGEVDAISNCRNLLHTAFDHGITHFDLANNYGPPAGAAESTFGKIFKEDFLRYRDELLLSTKAGYHMWDGPYGDWGSKKYLIASLDQSLKRMGVDYVDIFYHHRPDPNTPIEETMAALDMIVRQGKALYVGISSYEPAEAAVAIKTLRAFGTPCLIHQPKYSMFVRSVEDGLLELLAKEGVGCIAFSSLAQGLLTDKYLNDIPTDSRAGRGLENGAITVDAITGEVRNKIQQLNRIADSRGQSLAKMALAWVLKDERVTSLILGASKASQIEDALDAINNIDFDKQELTEIEKVLKG